MSNMWAYAGRKVVSVVDWRVLFNDPYWLDWLSKTPHLPDLNQVYTIRSVEPDSVDPNTIGLRLMEIHNPPAVFHGCAGPMEAQFNIQGFRPLDTRKTDIAVFTKILGPTPVNA